MMTRRGGTSSAELSHDVLGSIITSVQCTTLAAPESLQGGAEIGQLLLIEVMFAASLSRGGSSAALSDLSLRGLGEWHPTPSATCRRSG